MPLWISVFLLLFLALWISWQDLSCFCHFMGSGRNQASLQSVIASFHELEETLAAGIVPEPEKWARIEKLPDPWGTLSSESLYELRQSGAAILPTLLRLRTLAMETDAAWKDAKAKSSQALGQALLSVILVPVCGGLFYLLLPGLQEKYLKWGLTCLGAGLLSGAGGVWILCMAESARWGGLSSHERGSVLAVQCAGERFLSLLRSGSPADIAWVRACQFLNRHAPELAQIWGFSAWKPTENHADVQVQKKEDSAQKRIRCLANAGIGLRKSVQVSLMEGRPCGDRTEAVLASLREDWRAQVGREITLLSTRALKPLFICVAPALLGLLAAGLWLGCAEMSMFFSRRF